MTDPTAPSLIDALRATIAWLDAAGVPSVIVGGVAASLLGRPRATRDIDAVALVGADAWPALLQAGAQQGIEPRIADPLAFASRSRVLLLKHRPSGIEIDLSLGAIAFEIDMLGRATRLRVGGLDVPLPAAEDLIVMKALARRPRDIGDIEGILAAHPSLDRTRVRAIVASMAEALGDPSLVADLNRVLDSAGPAATS